MSGLAFSVKDRGDLNSLAQRVALALTVLVIPDLHERGNVEYAARLYTGSYGPSAVLKAFPRSSQILQLPHQRHVVMLAEALAGWQLHFMKADGFIDADAVGALPFWKDPRVQGLEFRFLAAPAGANQWFRIPKPTWCPTPMDVHHKLDVERSIAKIMIARYIRRYGEQADDRELLHLKESLALLNIELKNLRRCRAADGA